MIGPHLCVGRVRRAIVRSIVHGIRRSRIRRCIGLRHGVGPIVVGGNFGPIVTEDNSGSMMIGPYPFNIRRTAHRTSPHVHLPFPDHHNAMHMVRHHHEFPDVHMRHVLRYGIPTLPRQFADRRRMQYTMHDAPEPMQPVLGVDGQVLRALLGVIVTRPTVGRSFRQVGHGIPNIGTGSIDPIEPYPRCRVPSIACVSCDPFPSWRCL